MDALVRFLVSPVPAVDKRTRPDVRLDPVSERNGPVNHYLSAAGIIDQPLSMLFNSTGVYIGIVHVLLPYALLPIYTAMRNVDGLIFFRRATDLAAPLRPSFASISTDIARSGCWLSAGVPAGTKFFRDAP